MEMASSSAVTAGYLALLIFCSRLAGSVATPALLPRGARLPPPSIITFLSNMKAFQLAHQRSREVMSPAKQLITVGRLATPRPPARLIVLVTRSGIDASRFSPRLRSFMNPEMILRWPKDACHMASVSSTPPQPCVVISALSSAHIAGVKTSDTGTSRSPGWSMKLSTPCISVLYAASSCVTQYSNGLLLTAAMFQVAVFNLLSSSATFHRGPMHMVNRSLAEYCDDVLPMLAPALRVVARPK